MKAEQASSTAKVIAASTLLLAAGARSSALVPPGAAELCRAFLGTTSADQWLARSAQWWGSRLVWRGVEWLTHPGIIEHYWHRKRWIEQRVRLATRQGAQRLIVLGAGLDTLGCRLAVDCEAVEVIELDHPATQAVKAKVLAQLPTISSRLQLMPVDFLQDNFPDSMIASEKSTVLIAEGLLMYLSDAAIDQLLRRIAQFKAINLQLALSYMCRWPDQSIGFRPRSWLVERWLKSRGEPFTWAIADQQVTEFFAQRGFKVIEQALTADFSPPAQKLRGENLLWLEREGTQSANTSA